MSKISKKAAIQEIIRCGKDPVYFINTYAKIQHPVRGLLPFKTYPYQNDVINALVNNRFNIILKARQLGLTTILAAYISWFILLHRDKNVLVVATKQETAKNIIRAVRNIFKNLPKFIKDLAPITVDNRHSIELDNGSRVKAIGTSADAGRGEAVSLLVVDECAIIPNFSEIWTGLDPVISTGGSAVLLSTPLGTANFFHDCFMKAKNKDNNFNCQLGTYVNPNNPSEVYNDRLMWWVHPEHDLAWFENETRGKSPRDVAQELLCNFLASGDTFIDPETIQVLERQVKEPIEKFHLSENFWIWERPIKGCSYVISADIARGDGADYSGFHVLKKAGYGGILEQVAEYKGKIRPDHFGVILMEASKFYNDAMIAPENNGGFSGQTIMKMEQAKFNNLYYSKRLKPKFKDDEIMPDPFYASSRNDYIVGYSVTSANRVPMLAKLEQYLRLGHVVVRSSRFVDEVKTFIVKVTERGERPEAQRNCNDDLIMALAGGLWVYEDTLSIYRSDEMTEAMLAGISTSRTTTGNFSDFDFNNKNKQQQTEQNKIAMSDGSLEDLSWLITSG